MNLKKFFSTKSTPINSTTFNRQSNREFSITVDVIGKLTECADKHNVPYNTKAIDISELSKSVEQTLRNEVSKQIGKYNHNYDVGNMSIRQLSSLEDLLEEYEENLIYCRNQQVEDSDDYEKNFEPVLLRQLVERHQRKVNQQEVYHRADLMADRVPQY